MPSFPFKKHSITFKKHNVIILCLLLIFLSSCKKQDGNPTSPPIPQGPVEAKIFKVEGTKITINGSEFIGKGVNVNGPYWPWSRPTVPDVSLIADTWKFNIVRLNWWPEFNIHNSNNTDMDAIVKAFTDKKVVVMIEQHNYTGKYPDANELNILNNQWLEVAKKYRNNEYVWFNIMNEPGTGENVSPLWLSTHETVIKTIRNIAPNIIVLDEHAFGQANGFKASSNSAAVIYGETLTGKYKNLIFSLHLYSNWIYGKERLDNYINALHAKNLAVIIGEYGVANDYSMDVSSSVFKSTIPKKVGRIAWAWAGEDVHRLTTTGGGFAINNTSGSKPSNLSFAGNLVWMDNHNELTTSSSDLIPPPVILANRNFEDGAPNQNSGVGNGWINFGTSTIDNTVANVKQGSYAVKIAAGSGGGFGQPMYLEPGGTYRVTAWGKHDIATSIETNLGIKIKNTINAPEVSIATLGFTDASYQQKSATFTMPNQVAEVFLFVYKNAPAPIFWVDDILIEKL